MTQYFESRKKLIKGADWRGTAEVDIDDETYEWTIRQLKEEEFLDVIPDIDREAISELEDTVDRDEVEEYKTLREKDDLTDEEEQRYEELEETVNDDTLIDKIDRGTYSAIVRAAKYGVVPSEEDVDHFMSLSKREQEDLLGDSASVRSEAFDLLKEDMVDRIEDSVDMVGIQVGIQVVQATSDVEEAEGN